MLLLLRFLRFLRFFPNSKSRDFLRFFAVFRTFSRTMILTSRQKDLRVGLSVQPV